MRIECAFAPYFSHQGVRPPEEGLACYRVRVRVPRGREQQREQRPRPENRPHQRQSGQGQHKGGGDDHKPPSGEQDAPCPL